jgi:hypothetical protein
MGEDDHEMVYGLPCEEQSNERLFGVPRIISRWNDGVLEY